jgi:signal transduction histidine kinase
MLSSITRHDILNKLTGLRMYLELSKESVNDPVFLEYIEKEIDAAGAIERQIEFTRFYESIGMNAPQWQDVTGLIRSAASQLTLEDITFEILLPSVQVYSDALIEKVFYNLIENSLRHGGRVTKISFSFEEFENSAVIRYRDDGAGITPADKDKLFRRGFGKHTGLGLFLSREILSITGISITENGEPGKGVCFEIRVPKASYRLIPAQPL